MADKEEQDIWDQLQQLLDQPPEPTRIDPIISYKNAIPNIKYDPSTYLHKNQSLHIANPQSSFISNHQKPKNELNYHAVSQSFFDQLDYLPSYHPSQFYKTFLKSSFDTNITHYLDVFPLFSNELLSSTLPSIETILYANHNLLNDQIESINSTYLPSEFKSFSTNLDTIVKETKRKEKINLGDELLDESNFQIEELANQYLDARPNDNFQEFQQLSMTSDREFDERWSKLFKRERFQQEDNQKTNLNQQFIPLEEENNVISENDIKYISELVEIQKQAEKTAQKEFQQEDFDQANDDDSEEKQNEQVEQLEEENEENEENIFLDQVYYPMKVDEEIQEQNPEIRKKIQEALQVKTKFKIIKINDISTNQKNLKLNQNYKWAVEDESDMSIFYEYLPKDKMAKQYSFELDDFQKRAVLHLEKKESVLVCAHTSAGKTVIAEYAIALALKHNRRALYTSPIKALSNQKFREFEQKFGSVGVVTGDVSINREASCLILTTEILRQMLYRGSEMIRDIEWVIFDEVHYVNDQERGMVWEETIIMLPPHIGIIMLSATVPNYLDFANWVGRTKKKPIYVVKTLTRPVPLEHHLFLFDKFHMLKEKDSSFYYQEYAQLKKEIDKLSSEDREKKEKIKKRLEEKKEDELYKNTNQNMKKKWEQKQLKSRFIMNVNSDSIRFKEEKRSIIQLIRLCEKKQLLPCVMFIFSKKKIMELAEALIDIQGFKLIDKKQEGIIVHFFDKSLHKLKPQDRKSPQLLKIRALLRAGIGIHHGDLLPIAKEIVEILFSEGYIKVLLATETFAMGINMPTKTVIFQAIEKFDGQVNGLRMLHSSEYTQMSGRAGRRGLDEKGTVIFYVKDPRKLPEPMKMGKMLDGKGMNLDSKFRMTYQIILNLLTSQDMDANEMMKRSYHENYRFTALPQNLQRLERLKNDYVNNSIISCPYQKGIKSAFRKALIEEYVEIQKTFRSEQIEFIYGVVEQGRNNLSLPRYGLFLDHLGNISLCTVIQIELLHNKVMKRNYILSPEQNCLAYYKMLVMTVHTTIEDPQQQHRYKKVQLSYEKTTFKSGKQLRSDSTFIYMIHEIGEEDFLDFLEQQPVLNQRQNYNQSLDIIYEEYGSQLLEKQKNYEEMMQLLNQLYGQNKKKGTLSRLRYKLNKQVRNRIKQEEDGEDDQTYWKHRDEQIKELINSQCSNCDLKNKHLDQLERKQKIKEELDDLKEKVDENDIAQQQDFINRVQVLKVLGYVDENGIGLIKSRIARELGDNKSIYICEILVENIMDGLKPSKIASLLSGFVCQWKGIKDESNIIDYDSELPFDLSEAIKATSQLVRKIIEEERTLCVVEDEHKQFKSVLDFSMSLAIYQWAKGSTFVEICEEIEVEEGQIVRTIQRLENLMRGIKNCYTVMGNIFMVEQIDKAIQAIKKDIVFTESLYFNSESSKVKAIQQLQQQQL